MKAGGASASGGVSAVLLRRTTFRHWKAQPGRFFLLLGLLSLGVAVFLSMRLANRAAVASFSNFTGVLARQADATFQAPAGTLPESFLGRLRRGLASPGVFAGGAVELIPLVETICAPVGGEARGQIGSGATYTLMGLDLVALNGLALREGLVGSWLQPDGAQGPRGEGAGAFGVLGRTDAVFCSKQLADRLELGAGSRFQVVINDRRVELEVAGVIPWRADQVQAPENLLVMDLPALQELSGKTGRLDRVECVFPGGAAVGAAREAWMERLRVAAGGEATLRSPESRAAVGELMTRGFRLNLTILSMLALLVGLYLIFQALDAAVVRRRGEIGVLRALGVRDSEIRRAWLCEAALLGVGGGLLGVLGGWGLAQVTVRAVSRTVNALYYATNTRAAALHPGEAAAAFVLAVFCSILAGWIPARRAASTPPAQLWGSGSGAASGSVAKTGVRSGVALLGGAVALAFCPPLNFPGGGRFALAGYLSALFGVVGAGMAAGDLLRGAAWLSRPFSKSSASRQVGNSHLRAPTSRHRWAAAGLLCAVSMTGGMAVLVGSFERSVSGWIGRTLQADVYLTSNANQAANAFNRISPGTWKAIVSHPLVVDWDALLMFPVELSVRRAASGGTVSAGGVRLSGVSLGFYERRNQFSWVSAPGDGSVFDARLNAGLCLVSEALAERLHLKPQDALEVPVPGGVKNLRIAGVYTDYGDDQGVVMVDRLHLHEWFQVEDVSTLSLVLAAGADAGKFRSELAGRYPGLAVFTNVHLRGEVMRIFRQTFSITYALEAIGVVVALAGLGITLASILAERQSELTTLRALGMTAGGIAGLAAWEGFILALGGTLGGLLTSLGLGMLLVFVINKQTFGWTLQLAIPVASLVVFGLLVPLCGAGVAYIVGRYGADLPADRAS
jgi:putative ABC transport system permease protein